MTKQEAKEAAWKIISAYEHDQGTDHLGMWSRHANTIADFLLDVREQAIGTCIEIVRENKWDMRSELIARMEKLKDGDSAR